MNDREALHALQRGGRHRADAVRYLYRRHAARLLGFYLRHRLAPREAEALLQDAFVAIVRQAYDYFDATRPDVWLWGIGRKALLDHFRSSRPQEIPDDYALELLIDAPRAPAVAPKSAAGPDCAREAYAAFALDYADRAEILSRIAFDGWSLENAAAVLSRTPAATSAYLAESREKLRTYLKRCHGILDS